MRKQVAVALLALAACTSSHGAARAPETVAPSTHGTVVRRPSFAVDRVIATIRTLVTKTPYREAGSAAYRKAADLVAARFSAMGYRVRRQPFDVPAGTCNGIRVAAGRSQNVVAEPPGFKPGAPHLVVGGHLDTVPNTAGANDNASGPAVVLELARLAMERYPRMPVVFVAFGAEERRRQSSTRSEYSLGARAYLAAMSADRRRALRGMINVDMVGAGSAVHVVGRRGAVAGALYSTARRLHIPVIAQGTISQGFSDHVVFQAAGYQVGWLWAGNHPTLHKATDTMRIIQRAELQRVGLVAWETLRTLKL
jgi:peptidase M28-like protein